MQPCNYVAFSIGWYKSISTKNTHTLYPKKSRGTNNEKQTPTNFLEMCNHAKISDKMIVLVIFDQQARLSPCTPIAKVGFGYHAVMIVISIVIRLHATAAGRQRACSS
jgi:hypothetical protein